MSSFGKLSSGRDTGFVAKCERCGATPYGTGSICVSCRRRGFVKTAVITILLAEGVFLATLAIMPRNALNASAAPVAGETASLQAPTTVAPGWTSFNTEGDTSGDITHHAVLASDVPSADGKDVYSQGLTTGTMEVTSGQGDARSIVIRFAKQKVDCGKQHCGVRASFDETQPEDYAFADLSDDHATVLKVTDYDRFTQHLSVSHDLTLVARLGAGQPSVLRFTVAGYDSAAATQHLTFKLAGL
jgi:hypothetical protein